MDKKKIENKYFNLKFEYLFLFIYFDTISIKSFNNGDSLISLFKSILFKLWLSIIN